MTPLGLVLTVTSGLAATLCVWACLANVETLNFLHRTALVAPLTPYGIARLRRAYWLAFAYGVAGTACIALLRVVWEVCR